MMVGSWVGQLKGWGVKALVDSVSESQYQTH